MIDMSMGPVHISSGPGSDSRSMSLTILLSVLEKENNVIWMTRNLPDQRKIIDILGHLDDLTLSRMIVIEFGEDLQSKLNEINILLSKFKKNDLLIIESWCENYGRAKAEEISLMKKLVENYGDKKIIITSESYEDASSLISLLIIDIPRDAPLAIEMKPFFSNALRCVSAEFGDLNPISLQISDRVGGKPVSLM